MERTQVQTQDLAKLAAQTRSAQLDQSQAIQKQHDSARREVEDLRADKRLLLEEQTRLREKVKTLEEIAHDRSLDMAKQKDVLGSTIANVKVQNARELEQLREQLEQLQTQLAAESTSSSKRESETGTLQAVQAAYVAQKKELDSLREASERQQAALTSSQRAQDEADKRLEAANKQVWALKRQREDVAADLEKARSELKVEAQRAVSQREKFEQQIGATQAELEASMREVTRPQELSRQLEAENSRLRATLEQLKGEAQSAASQRERFEHQLGAVQAQLDVSRRDVARPQELSRQLEAENSRLRASVEQLKGEAQRAATLQVTVEAQRVELQALRDDNEKMQAQIQALQKQLNSLSAEGIGLMDGASGQMKEIQNSHDEALARIERLSLERHELQERAEELEAERDVLMEEKKALAEIVEDLHASCLGAGLNGLSEEHRQSMGRSMGNRSIDQIFQGKGF